MDATSRGRRGRLARGGLRGRSLFGHNMGSGRDRSETESSRLVGPSGSHSFPTLGPVLRAPDEASPERISNSRDISVEKPETKYVFVKDMTSLQTYYNVRSLGASLQKKIYMHGVLAIQNRLVQKKSSHVAMADNELVSTSSPLKSSLKDALSSVAVVASYSWKTGGQKKVCEFVVNFERRLDKTAYQKPKSFSGDDAATVAFLNKDHDLWTEFITNELSIFEDNVCLNPKSVLHLWERVGLQADNRRQEDDIFVWNSAVAHVYSRTTRCFVRVSLAEAGYFHMPLEKLDEVTVCLNKPTDDVSKTIHESLGDLNFMTFLCVAGQCLLACRPRFVHDILQMKLPTTVLIGKPDSGKTFLAELAVLIVGNDRKSGHAFSHNHISEHEFGKRTLKGTVPILISDPPQNNAKQYAEVVQHVFDGTRRQTNALMYDPGAAPIILANGDFFKVWQNMDPEGWSRIASRLIVVWISEPITFPGKNEDIYRKAQSLSAYLPALLHFPEDRLKESLCYYTTELTKLLPEELLLYDSRKRNVESLALLYAFAEMISKVLKPDYDFRKVLPHHAKEVTLPSISRYLAQVESFKSPVAAASLSMSIKIVLQDVVEYALSHPEVTWYMWIQWSLVHDSKRAVAIRKTFTGGLYGKHVKSIQTFLQNDKNLGSCDKVNYRVPKEVIPRGQHSQHSLVFYVSSLPIKLQHQLATLDVVARESAYKGDWVAAAKKCFCIIEETEDSELLFYKTAEIAERWTKSLRDGCEEADLVELDIGSFDSAETDGSNTVSASNFVEQRLNAHHRTPVPESEFTATTSELAQSAREGQSFSDMSQSREPETQLPEDLENRNYSRNNDLPDPENFDKWFNVQGREEVHIKLIKLGIPVPSCETIDTVAADCWRCLSAHERQRWTSGYVHGEGGSQTLPVFTATSQIQENENDQETSSATLVTRATTLNGPKLPKEADATSCMNRERQKKRSRKQPKLSLRKKRTTYPCATCKAEKRKNVVVPCSLNEKCKNWICRECCVAEKSVGWFNERQDVQDYDNPESIYFITCASCRKDL